MEKNEIEKKALSVLYCSIDRVEKVNLPDINAHYFRNTDRGGAAVIISDDGSMLYVDPFFVEYEDHVKRFVAGERTVFQD